MCEALKEKACAEYSPDGMMPKDAPEIGPEGAVELLAERAGQDHRPEQDLHHRVRHQGRRRVRGVAGCIYSLPCRGLGKRPPRADISRAPVPSPSPPRKGEERTVSVETFGFK